MQTFLKDVLVHLREKGLDSSKLTFVLPSKRACTFLLKELAKLNNTAQFSPILHSIESFIEELSELKPIQEIDLLFEFYEVYLENPVNDPPDSFDSFLKWSVPLIQDFNEIDRYLIEPEKLFNHLEAIKEVSLWMSDENRTPMIDRYLSLWKQLNTLYKGLYAKLLHLGRGYQGMLYREAVNNIENYLQSAQSKHHIFLGFNALNTAESRIIRELIVNNNAEIYWDIDEIFLKDKLHNAGHFIRDYKQNWKGFHSDDFLWEHSHYQSQKKIQVAAIPRQIGQAKYVGQILAKYLEKGESLENTAVVLADENLLIPVIHALPDRIASVNVTMGYPLNTNPLAFLFESLFEIHKSINRTYYYKDVIRIMNHPYIHSLINQDSLSGRNLVVEKLEKNNISFVGLDGIIKLDPANESLYSLLFTDWKNPKTAIKRSLELIFLLKNQVRSQSEQDSITLELLYRFYTLFNRLESICQQKLHISDIPTLSSVFKSLLKKEKLNFVGEPLQGLQIMGMLESRALDFDKVIICSVNEGILPSGKQYHSFIPYDTKKHYGLPTYTEKDAIYAYHFYRLIQRASEVVLIYDTEPDSIGGGEKSRFITQMELDGIHHIENVVVTTDIPSVKTEPLSIVKNTSILNTLQEIATGKGFSPSAFLKYIRDPMEYYSRYVLGIKEDEKMEEIVADNTFGTVLHEVLNELYEPFVGDFLSDDKLEAQKHHIHTLTLKHFKSHYLEGDLKSGKNLIIFEIAKRYLTNWIDQEINELKSGASIKIMGLEQNVSISINISGLPFPLKLKGQIDRIDMYNGTFRIIDYKSGKVENTDVQINDWEMLTQDYKKYAKSFQVLFYTYLMWKSSEIKMPAEAGIISFKNLGSGFLKFTFKDEYGDKTKKISAIDEEMMLQFENVLRTLILEIFNPEIPFTENLEK